MSARNEEKTRAAPLETRPGEQKDDNIDEFGRRNDGTEEDQPTKDDSPRRKRVRPDGH